MQQQINLTFILSYGFKVFQQDPDS